MGITNIIFALLKFIENKNIYIAVAMLSRFLQGTSSAIISATMYSICANFYPSRTQRLIGYMNAAEGLGSSIGPAVGSVLYIIGGYKFMFLTIGCIFIVFGLFIKVIFKSDID